MLNAQDLSTNQGARVDAGRAFRAYFERWCSSYREAQARFARNLPNAGIGAVVDFVWDKGVLDLVSPIDVETRDALHEAGTGLPWGHRMDPNLYMRLLYAGHAQKMAANLQGFSLFYGVLRHTGAMIDDLPVPRGKTLGEIMDFNAAKSDALLQGLLDVAAHQVRLRTGNREAPKPIKLGSRVRVDGVEASVVAYEYDGRIRLARTLPAERHIHESTPCRRDDCRSWTSVMPWEIEPIL